MTLTDAELSPTWPTVEKFATAMEAKLARNRHKGDRPGWLAMEPEALLKRLKDEVAELETEVAIWRLAVSYRLPDEVAWAAGCVLDEASDVANFCMMVADNVKERSQNQR